MTKKPTYFYSLVLSETTPEKELVNLYSNLQKAKLSYEISTKLDPKKLIFIYIEDFKVFLQEADNLNFEKAKKSKKTLDTKYVDSLKKDKYYYFLKRRESLDPVIKKLESSSCFKFRIRHKFLKPEVPLDDYELIAQTLFDPQEFIRTVHYMLNKMEIEGADQESQSLIEYLQHKKYLIDIVPLHNYNPEQHRANFYNDDYIKKYFGEHISIYFKFLAYLQKWLLAPVILGLLVYLINLLSNQSVTNSPYESFYSIFIIIWGNLFLVFWEKQEQKIGYSWKCFGKSFETQESQQNFTESFDERINDVTGLTEKYYPSIKRLFKYLISALLSLPILFATFVVLMLSLNLRGFVIPEHTHIYFKPFSDLAQPGQIFDKTTSKILLPTVLHVVVVSLLNKCYKNLSEWTSHNEYHKTYLEYENSLIVKRFIFEMFNTFTDFIYIGFIRLDIEGLKKVLLALFTVDEFRRVIIETLIPLIQRRTKETHKKAKTDEFVDNDMETYQREKVLELGLTHYESFDDYLEVIINFGYVTLFASATPLAPLFIYLFHFIEGYSDRYKIFNLYRRPLPVRAKNIGSWKSVLIIMTLLSVITNIFLFSFSSNQLIRFCGFESKEEFIKHIIAIVFVLEHCLFVIIWIMRKTVLSREDWTNIYWGRKLYKQKIRKLKLEGAGQSTIQT